MDIGEDDTPKITLDNPGNMPMGFLAGEPMGAEVPMETSENISQLDNSDQKISLDAPAAVAFSDEFGLQQIQEGTPQIQLEQTDPSQNNEAGSEVYFAQGETSEATGDAQDAQQYQVQETASQIPFEQAVPDQSSDPQAYQLQEGIPQIQLEEAVTDSSQNDAETYEIQERTAQIELEPSVADQPHTDTPPTEAYLEQTTEATANVQDELVQGYIAMLQSTPVFEGSQQESANDAPAVIEESPTVGAGSIHDAFIEQAQAEETSKQPDEDTSQIESVETTLKPSEDDAIDSTSKQAHPEVTTSQIQESVEELQTDNQVTSSEIVSEAAAETSADEVDVSSSVVQTEAGIQETTTDSTDNQVSTTAVSDAEKNELETSKTEKTSTLTGRVIGNIIALNHPDWVPTIQAVEANAEFSGSAAEESMEVTEESKEAEKVMSKVEGIETKVCSIPVTKCKPCLKCNRGFMEAHEFEDHDCTPIEGPDKIMLNCQHCSERFENNAALQRHLKSKHAKPKPTATQTRRCSSDKEETKATEQCPHCSKRFKTKELLIQHKKKEHVKVYPCKQCNMKFDQESLLQRHIYRAHEKEKEVKQKDNGQPSKEEAVKKMKSPVFKKIKKIKPAAKEAIPMQVVVGGKVKMKKFPSTSDPGPKRGAARLQCKRCGAIFKSIMDLAEHRKEATCTMAEEDNDEPRECEECGKEFRDVRSLEKHLLECKGSDNEEDEFWCDECDKGFPTKYQLDQHNSSKHKRYTFKTPFEVNLKCHICQKSFSSKPRLATHIAIKHHEEEEKKKQQEKVLSKTGAKSKETSDPDDIRCDECNTKFTRRDNLLRHILNTGHTGDKHLIKVTKTTKKKAEPEDEEEEPESDSEPLADVMSDDDEEWTPDAEDLDSFSPKKKSSKDVQKTPKLQQVKTPIFPEGRLYCSCGLNYSRNHDFITHLAKLNHRPASFQTKNDDGTWKHVKEPPEGFNARKPGSKPPKIVLEEEEGSKESEPEAQYVCYFCQKTFSNKSSLRTHLAVKHKVYKKIDDSRPMPKPKKKIDDKPRSAYEIAMDSGEDEEGFVCRVCDRRYSAERGLQRHVKETGHSQTVQMDPASKEKKKPLSEDFKCTVCEKLFNAEKGLKRHIIETGHGREKGEDHYGPNSFTTPDETVTEDEYRCRECNKIFPDAATLKEHCISHPTFMCRRCGKTYDTKQALLTHEKLLHAKKPVPEKPAEPEPQPSTSAEGDAPDTPQKTSTPKPKPAKTPKEPTPKGPTNCEVCQRPFLNMHALRIHQEKMHGIQVMSKPHACEDCHMRFDQAHRLRQHIMIKHQGKKAYREIINADRIVSLKCASCDQVFLNERNLKTHLSLKHGGQASEQYKSLSSYECHICHKKLQKRSQLYKHVTVVHKIPFGRIKYYECDICDEAFAEQKQLDAHVAMHNERKFQCPHCPLKFYRERGLELHMKKHGNLPMPTKPYKTTTSGGTAVITLPKNVTTGDDDDENMHNDSDSFEKYFTNAEPEKPQIESPFTCDECGKVFIAQIYLDKHKGTQHAKAHTCKVCFESFGTLRQLNFHHSTRHPIIKRKLLCPHPKCPHFFYKQDQLDRHRRRIHGRFPCRFCGKRFDQVANLNEHIRDHSGEKPYLCDVCNENFHTLETLKGHFLTTHATSTKKKGKRTVGTFACETCGKIFTSKGTKEFHVRKVHTGEKPFECKTCQQAFFSTYTLSFHRRNKHPEEYPQKDEAGKTIQLKCNYCVEVREHGGTLIL